MSSGEAVAADWPVLWIEHRDYYRWSPQSSPLLQSIKESLWSKRKKPRIYRFPAVVRPTGQLLVSNMQTITGAQVIRIFKKSWSQLIDCSGDELLPLCEDAFHPNSKSDVLLCQETSLECHLSKERRFLNLAFRRLPLYTYSGAFLEKDGIPPQSSLISCDGCLSIPIVGIAFRCQRCLDVDLCSSCFQDDKKRDNACAPQRTFLNNAKGEDLAGFSGPHQFSEINSALIGSESNKGFGLLECFSSVFYNRHSLPCIGQRKTVINRKRPSCPSPLLAPRFGCFASPSSRQQFCSSWTEQTFFDHLEANQSQREWGAFSFSSYREFAEACFAVASGLRVLLERQVNSRPQAEWQKQRDQFVARWPLIDESEENAAYACPPPSAKATRDRLESDSLNVFVGLCAENSAEWLASHFGVMFAGFCLIPLYSSATCDEIKKVCEQTPLSCVICNAAQIHKFLPFASIKNFIIIDDGCVGSEEILCFPFQTVAKMGASLSCQLLLPPRVYPIYPLWRSLRRMAIDRILDLFDYRAAQPRLMMIQFTSGSTGMPKGALFDELLILRDFSNMGLLSPHIIPLFAPLAFISARDHFINTCMRFGTTFIISRPTSLVLDELQAIHPTKVSSVPAFFNSIMDMYNKMISIEALPPHKARKQLSSIFGQRIQLIVTGGAQITQNLGNFLRTTFPHIRYMTAYGTTEAGGISTNDSYNHGIRDVKLRDVPELGYFSTDQPYPRGEVLVLSTFCISGYFKNDDANSEFFEDGGYFCTGDIAERRPSGAVILIDRKKNIFKLSSGLFVSPAQLEDVYSKSHLISQIYLHGEPSKNSVVAIVVPPASCRRELQSLADTLRLEEERRRVARLIHQDFVRLAQEEGLRPHETPGAVFVNLEPFSVENCLLTNNFKPNRPRCSIHFRDTIEQLYNSISACSSLAESRSAALICDMIETQTGIKLAAGENFAVGIHFDSLSAVYLHSFIKRTYGIELPLKLLMQGPSVLQLADIIYGPSQSPLLFSSSSPSSSTFILDQLGSKEVGMSIEAEKREIIESLGQTDYQVFLDDYERFVRLDFSSIAEEQESFSSNQPVMEEDEQEGNDSPPPLFQAQSILLTGATGFVGSFLLVELLQQTKAEIIVLLHRPENDSQGYEETEACLSVLVNVLYKRFLFPHRELLECHASRIRCVFGDISKPLLGLRSLENYLQMCRKVDSVIHSAAYVHWTAPYQGKMRQSNVVGTFALISFCRAVRRKALHFISTISVDSLIRLPPLGTSGYGLSKTLAEVLVAKSVSKRGLKAQIYRLGAVGAHSRFGTCNFSDFINRFAFGCLQLGCYPESDSLSLEIVPVDYVSAAVIGLASTRTWSDTEDELRSSNESISLSLSTSLTSSTATKLVVKSFLIVNNSFLGMRDLALSLNQFLGDRPPDHDQQQAWLPDQVKAVPTECFLDLIDRSSGENELFKLLPLMRQPGFWGVSKAFEDSQTIKYLCRAGFGFEERKNISSTHYTNRWLSFLLHYSAHQS